MRSTALDEASGKRELRVSDALWTGVSGIEDARRSRGIPDRLEKDCRSNHSDRGSLLRCNNSAVFSVSMGRGVTWLRCAGDNSASKQSTADRTSNADRRCLGLY